MKSMRQLILKVQSFLILLVLVSANVQAQKSPVDMDRFIDESVKRMTLEEKIGQLNLPVTGEITTGQAKSSMWLSVSVPVKWADSLT